MITDEQLLHINYYYYNKTEMDSILDNYALKNHTHDQYLTNASLDSKVDIAQGTNKALKNVVTDANGNITTEAKPTIPTSTSQLTNDSNYITTNDPRLSDSRTPTSHTHGNITNDGKIGTTANKPIITTTGGSITVGNFEDTSSNIKMNGNVKVGTRNTFARGDHVHPSDTNKANVEHTHLANDVTDLDENIEVEIKKAYRLLMTSIRTYGN